MSKERNILPSYFVMPFLKTRLIPIEGAAAGIITQVCDHYGLSEAEIKKPCRQPEFLFPRQLCMFLIYKKTNLTHKKIGAIFGKDHSTIVHACKMIQNYIDTNSLNKRAEILNLLSTLNVQKPDRRA